MKGSVKSRSRDAIFTFQLADGVIKAVMGVPAAALRKQIRGIMAAPVAVDADESAIRVTLEKLLDGLGGNGRPVVVCLPRSAATCRFLKIPTQSSSEIERALSLQATSFLPYPSDELIMGYQVIENDREGYAYVNLTIVHRDSVERYVRILQPLKPARISVVLSSYGLSHLYSSVAPQPVRSVILLDVDGSQIEFVVIHQKKVLFSRSFKLNRQTQHWQSQLIDEIAKSRDAYTKETSREAPDKVIVMGSGETREQFIALLTENALSAESFAYAGKLGISEKETGALQGADRSFAAVVGVAMGTISDTLNLVPGRIKAELRKRTEFRLQAKVGLLIAGTLLAWWLAFLKGLDNKAAYLQRLQGEVDALALEARDIEQIEKRFKRLESQASRAPSVLEVLYALHSAVPQHVNLSMFSYEEDPRAYVSLQVRGQTRELESVFHFLDNISREATLLPFGMKVKYATQKKTPAGEFIDFEISGSNRS